MERAGCGASVGVAKAMRSSAVPTLVPQPDRAVASLSQACAGIQKIAKQVGCGVSVVQRVITS